MTRHFELGLIDEKYQQAGLKLKIEKYVKHVIEMRVAVTNVLQVRSM